MGVNHGMRLHCTHCNETSSSDSMSYPQHGDSHENCKEGEGRWIEEPAELLFSRIREHVGHKIVCVRYGEMNAAVECETCNCVIIDSDRYTEDS